MATVRPNPNPNSLVRSVPCEVCGGRMLWTQNAWPPTGARGEGLGSRAAYQCMAGHVTDPAETPQCPGCGVHDTAWTEASHRFTCRRCGVSFDGPPRDA